LYKILVGAPFDWLGRNGRLVIVFFFSALLPSFALGHAHSFDAMIFFIVLVATPFLFDD
jgi:hypothetical protein